VVRANVGRVGGNGNAGSGTEKIEERDPPNVGGELNPLPEERVNEAGNEN
jgi:hypothetical protein